MKYPIDAEQFIAEMRAETGTKESTEEIYRIFCIPAINKAYLDGKAGKSGYPKDPAIEIAAFEKVKGPLRDGSKRFITDVICCANSAYIQGRQDAKEAAR